MEEFRHRFGAGNRAGGLDWAPVATLGGTIAIYDAVDRRTDGSPLAIAATRGTHLLGDPPQIWPPVLRMK